MASVPGRGSRTSWWGDGHGRWFRYPSFSDAGRFAAECLDAHLKRWKGEL